MTMKAKAPTLEDLKKARACSPGYRWYKENDGDVVRLAREYPDWYLWLAGRCPGDWIDLKRLDACAEKWPEAALQFVAKLLTKTRLAYCAKICPGAALAYATDLLTPERLDDCAEKMPLDALIYAAKLLTPERLDACAEIYPLAALKYAADLLTPERLEACKLWEKGE